MGPGPRGRGSTRAWSRKEPRRWLQWGLDHVVEDLRRTGAGSTWAAWLQWGLDHVVEDLSLVQPRSSGNPKLQWGLDHVVEDLPRRRAKQSLPGPPSMGPRPLGTGPP